MSWQHDQGRQQQAGDREPGAVGMPPMAELQGQAGQGKPQGGQAQQDAVPRLVGQQRAGCQQPGSGKDIQLEQSDFVLDPHAVLLWPLQWFLTRPTLSPAP